MSLSFGLPGAACVVGAIHVALSVPLLLLPSVSRRVLAAFPRSVWPGRFLVVLDLAWVAYVVKNDPHPWLPFFELIRPYIYWAAPVIVILIIVLLDELLSPRALGGLLLLVANPVLNAIRWHPSPFRLFMALLAYCWVVAGIILVLSPYRFRKAFAFWIENDARCRVMGLLTMVVGGLLFGVSLLVR